MFFHLWGWAVIYFCIYYALNINDVNTLSPLVWQLLTGHSAELNPAMWYQSVLIWLTLLLFLICKHIHGWKRKTVLIGMICVALLMEYSGLNYSMFYTLPYEIRYPFGRLIEMVTYAAMGVLLVKYCMWIIERSHRIVALGVSAGLLGIFGATNNIIPEAPGFQYSGFPLLGISVSAVLFVLALPLDRLPLIIKQIIMIASRYTLGIYCMHNMVGKLLSIVAEKYSIRATGFIACVLIYGICYCISWLFSRAPNLYFRLLVS